MEGNTETLSLYQSPAMALSVAIAKQIEVIRLAQVNMVKQYNDVVSAALRFPFAEFLKNIHETQTNMAKSLQFALNPFLTQIGPTVSIQEAEIVESEYDLSNLSISMGGVFLFNGEHINTISTNSKHGRFLKMLLDSEDNYVSDKYAIRELDLVDEEKGIGYLRRDLKRDLLRSNIEIKLHRQTKRGYSLVSVKRILN